MIFYIFSGVTSLLVFKRFANYILLFLLSGLYFIYKLVYKVYDKYLVRKTDRIYFSRKIDLPYNDDKLFEYTVFLKDKKYTCCVINTEERCFNKTEVLQNFKINEKKRNNILHCNISLGEQLIVDLTDIMRRFVIYYQRDISCNFEYFMTYVNQIEIDSGKNYLCLEDLNSDKCELVVYLNDENFTELKYNLRDIYDKNLYDLLITN